MTQGFVNPYTYAVSAPTVTTYTSGSGTYTVPSGVQFLVVEMCGGGGGGGGCGAGKGAGGNGGTTSFGSWTAIGGTGAIATNGPNNPSAPGAGGSGGASGAGTQVFRVAGASGGSGIGITSIGMTSQGPGGGSILSGGNAWFQGTANVNGLPGMGQGGGGAGAAGSDNSAAGGGGGGEQVQFIISSPAATYSYAVGVGGTAGAGAAQGGAGGSGVIVIYEYYQTLGIPTTLTLPLTVNQGGTGVTTSTGTGSTVLSNSPTLVTPSLGVATGTSFNGLTGAATQADQETATSTTTYVSPGRQQFHPSASKMWCYATYSGGTPVNNASYNQSSITDTNVGIMTHNFTVSFSSNNYVPLVTRPDPSNLQYTPSATAIATGSCQSYTLADTGVPGDFGRVICCFGDQ